MNANISDTGSSKQDTSKSTLTRRSVLRGVATWVGAGASGLSPFCLLASPLRSDAADLSTSPEPPCLRAARRSYPPLLLPLIQKLDPAQDVFPTEVYVLELERQMEEWSETLRRSARELEPLQSLLSPELIASSLSSVKTEPLRSGASLRTERRSFAKPDATKVDFLQGWQKYIEAFKRLEVAEFEIYGTRMLSDAPLRLECDVHYDFVGTVSESAREQRTGTWTLSWRRDDARRWLAEQWTWHGETLARLTGPGFTEITSHVLDPDGPGSRQLAAGMDHWRSVLDAAIGIDVYGNHGVAVGDIDGSGWDSFYVCQPSGLPNRLFRNRGDGTFEDVTESSGTGVLDGTASAIFADFRNRGQQDLLVLRSGGPLLFENMGGGRFEPRPEAFHFARPLQGTLTSVAVADYDRDGYLDVYLCVYSYYQGLSQYQFPSPYYDAQNGPPNFLFRNRGDGTFEDVTIATGMDQNNNRFSFAAEWCDFDGDGWPDLYVANDFGRKNLYRNDGKGRFTDVAAQAGVEDYGPGMSTCWLDYNNDGRPDLYIANMWLREGKRITEAPQFLPEVPEKIRALYRKHNAGNSMYRNRGDGTFGDETLHAGTARGGWSWSCASWDFDGDGALDLYVANGFVSGPNREDVQSFFWRQVAQRSSMAAGANSEYELAWNAVNELVRSDYSWSGYQRNNFYSNNGDGTFTEISGILGLDLRDDSRAFALSDFDHDGRLEFVLKNRTGPQLRLLHNDLAHAGRSVVLRLRGHASNRDAIGSAVTLEYAGVRQMRQLSAGSGFASQHTKELFFGIGEHKGEVSAVVRWPSGESSRYEHLPVNCRITLEEGKAGMQAVPFAKLRTPPLSAAPLADVASQDSSTVWLAAPLYGPDLKLRNATGAEHALSGLRGQPVLLLLLDMSCGESAKQLDAFRRGSAALSSAGLHVFAVRVGEAGPTAGLEDDYIPLLVATEKDLAAWNIQYRYLFDRRRDLSFPISFLMDRDGATVCVYQGPVAPTQVRADLRSLPSTPGQRLAKATPYPGPYFGNPITRDEFTYAVAFVEYGLFDEAQAALERVLKINPNYGAAWFNLGTIYLNKKQYGDAERCLREAVRLDPGDSDGWNNLGMIAGEQGRYEDALTAFRNSARANPNHVAAVTNMMEIYHFQGRPAEAQRTLEELIAKAPENPDLHLGLAMAMQGQGDSAGAIAQLETAIHLRPNFPDAINNLGTVRMQTGDRDGALKDFERCRGIAPDLDRPVLNESVLYARAGQSEKARQLLQSFLDRHPENADVRGALTKLEAAR